MGMAVHLTKGKINVSNDAGVIEMDANKELVNASIKNLKSPPVLTNTPSPEFKLQPAISPNVPGATSPTSTPISPNQIQTSGFCIK
jgi:hypothetical protein